MSCQWTAGAEEEDRLQLPADFQVEIDELFTTVPAPVKTPVRKQAGEAQRGHSPAASPDDGPDDLPQAGQRKRKGATRCDRAYSNFQHRVVTSKDSHWQLGCILFDVCSFEQAAWDHSYLQGECLRLGNSVCERGCNYEPPG